MARDARVDEQIANAPEFARPVLRHMRELVHKGAPEVEETIKWGRPFFLLNGRMLCFIAAFKQHCTFGFVGPEMRAAAEAEGVPVDEAGGVLGRITSVEDLPSDEQMLRWLRKAAALASGPAKKRTPKPPKPEVEVPAELQAALQKNKAADKVFQAFSPSCRREYAEWIAEAKRPETREKRVTQAVEWIAEGKQRNWKYQNC